MKKIYLEDLNKKKSRIDWKNTIGKKIRFIYNDLEDEVEIIDYKDKYLRIRYKDREKEIHIANFIKCKIGNLIKQNTSEFKIEIGTKFNDGKRNLTIIGRKYIPKKSCGKIINYKYYIYQCNTCGYIGEILESNILLHKQGCSVCSSKKVLSGINDIFSIAPWMMKLGVSENDAKKYAPNSNKKVKIICPDCGRIKFAQLSHIYERKSIGCVCGDGYSYPEKFMMSFLNQLGVDFEVQFSTKNWNMKINRLYDFYLPRFNIIIETHGEQHYKENNSFCRTLLQEQENDKLKESIAKAENISDYIIIDCRFSQLEYIKNSILNSNLINLFDIEKIDWNECELNARNNMVRNVCRIKWKYPETSVNYIASISNLSKTTIRRWLKVGSKLGWCQYGGINERKRAIEIFKDGKSLGKYESASYIEKISKDKFGVKLLHSNIALVASGKQSHHHNYYFKYVDN